MSSVLKSKYVKQEKKLYFYSLHIPRKKVDSNYCMEKIKIKN